MIAHGSLAGHVPATVAAIAAVVVYHVAWSRRPTSTVWPVVSWSAGVTVAVTATMPPVEAMAARSFTGHMVQHLVFLMVSAPLLVWARPWRTFTRAFSGGHRHLHRFALPASPLRAVLRDYGALLAAAAAFVFMVLVHLTALYDAALRSPVVHDVEHVGFLAAGVASWSVVMAGGRRRGPTQMMAIFATITAMSLLSMVLLAAGEPLSQVYADRAGTAAALDDQRNGATLMWISGLGVTLPMLLVATWRWATLEERIAHRIDSL
jgi:putative membrane protein